MASRELPQIRLGVGRAVPRAITASKPLSETGKKIILALLGIFFAASTSEVALRLTSHFDRLKARTATGKLIPLDVYDPDLGYRLNPSHPAINAQGLKDHPVGPKSGRFRILMLGDSIGFMGESADDTFVAHMRDSVQRVHGAQNVDVVNACVPGYTNYQEVMFLKKYGLALDPDQVGFEFCLNDLHKFTLVFRVRNGEIVGREGDPSDEIPAGFWPFVRNLPRHSFLYVWLHDHAHSGVDLIRWKVKNGYSFDYNPEYRTAWQDQPWQEIERQLADVANIGKQRHFTVFLVAFPLAAQYDSGYLARDRNYVLKPQRKLREICNRLGIEFYDIYPDLNKDMFMPDGVHLLPEGRQVAGNHIAEYLERRNLLARAQPRGGADSPRSPLE
jgi:lysophospholipase L1-like esterase